MEHVPDIEDQNLGAENNEGLQNGRRESMGRGSHADESEDQASNSSVLLESVFARSEPHTGGQALAAEDTESLLRGSGRSTPGGTHRGESDSGPLTDNQNQSAAVTPSRPNPSLGVIDFARQLRWAEVLDSGGPQLFVFLLLVTLLSGFGDVTPGTVYWMAFPVVVLSIAFDYALRPGLELLGKEVKRGIATGESSRELLDFLKWMTAEGLTVFSYYRGLFSFAFLIVCCVWPTDSPDESPDGRAKSSFIVTSVFILCMVALRQTLSTDPAQLTRGIENFRNAPRNNPLMILISILDGSAFNWEPPPAWRERGLQEWPPKRAYVTEMVYGIAGNLLPLLGMLIVPVVMYEAVMMYRFAFVAELKRFIGLNAATAPAGQASAREDASSASADPVVTQGDIAEAGATPPIAPGFAQRDASLAGPSIPAGQVSAQGDALAAAESSSAGSSATSSANPSAGSSGGRSSSFWASLRDLRARYFKGLVSDGEDAEVKEMLRRHLRIYNAKYLSAVHVTIFSLVIGGNYGRVLSGPVYVLFYVILLADAGFNAAYSLFLVDNHASLVGKQASTAGHPASQPHQRPSQADQNDRPANHQALEDVEQEVPFLQITPFGQEVAKFSWWLTWIRGITMILLGGLQLYFVLTNETWDKTKYDLAIQQNVCGPTCYNRTQGLLFTQVALALALGFLPLEAYILYYPTGLLGLVLAGVPLFNPVRFRHRYNAFCTRIQQYYQAFVRA